MQDKYQAPFAPLVPGFKAGKLNDCESVAQLVNDKTCAVIIEPIQVRPQSHLTSWSRDGADFSQTGRRWDF